MARPASIRATPAKSGAFSRSASVARVAWQQAISNRMSAKRLPNPSQILSDSRVSAAAPARSPSWSRATPRPRSE